MRNFQSRELTIAEKQQLSESHSISSIKIQTKKKTTYRQLKKYYERIPGSFQFLFKGKDSE